MQKRIKLKDSNFRLYLTENKINMIIRDLADSINRDYQHKCPLIIIVLNGAFMFAGDLLKKLTIDCEVNFIRLSSYDGINQSESVKEIIGLENNLAGRDIIIVEDIIESGLTLSYLLNALSTSKANTIEVCALFLKQFKFNQNYHIKYIGKEIPEEFIVGYGLDYKGLGRNYPNLYQISK